MRKRSLFRLRNPRLTEREFIQDLNDSLRERRSRFILRCGGWSSINGRMMRWCEIWDFNKGWVVGVRIKDDSLLMVDEDWTKDIIAVLVEDNFAQRVDPKTGEVVNEVGEATK